MGDTCDNGIRAWILVKKVEDGSSVYESGHYGCGPSVWYNKQAAELAAICRNNNLGPWEKGDVWFVEELV